MDLFKNSWDLEDDEYTGDVDGDSEDNDEGPEDDLDEGAFGEEEM